MAHTITIGETEKGEEVQVPAKWNICGSCRGEGTRAHHGIAFTSEEWAEACDGDSDFADDYMAGRYDTTCEECDGAGKVLIVDEDRLTAAQRTAVEEFYRDRAADRASARMWARLAGE